MSSIECLKATSQEYLAVFDFRTKTWHSYRVSKKYTVETRGPEKTFDPPELFPFLQDLNNPERTVNDLMLDCLWDEHGNIKMEITDGLLAMLPEADPNTIIFAIKGKEKTQGEPIYLGNIGYIVVNYLEKERTEKEGKDDELLIENPKEGKQYALPTGYSTHGGIGTKTKTAKVDKKEKHKLYIVPERPKGKEKRVRKKLSRPDVVKYFLKVNPRSNWQVTFKAILKDSKYRDLAMDSRTGHKRTKWARIYSRGIDRLANTTGQCDQTVKRHIKLMIEQKIIKEVWHGFKGQGYSRLEIPLNMDHVFAWRRKPPK
ncbi:unnamed protein product [marine sediment metagenome]|uniref:Uncharacterized protein n=1 Tax=marine sediment metagenome TaxID=412755 RepID=X1R4I9_9ZZZZ